MLPGPGLVLLVCRETIDLGRNWARAPRGPQAHIDPVKDAVIGLCGETADQPLCQSRKVLCAMEPARAVRFRTFRVEVINNDEIEIRACRHLAATEFSERQDGSLLADDAAVQAREMVLDGAVE